MEMFLTMHKTQVNNLRKLSKSYYEILRKLSRLTKNMYNVGVYSVRQNFFANGSYLDYYKTFEVCKHNENHKHLRNTTQTTLQVVDANFKSFFALLKKKKQGQYQAKVNIPHYLPKDGYFQITWNLASMKILDDQIRLSLSKDFKKDNNLTEDFLYFPLPPNVNKETIKEVRIVPNKKATFFKMCIVYKEEPIKHDLNQNEYLSIDLGVTNFATCVSTIGTSFIMDGRRIKSINQKWNKEVARLKSILDKQEPNSKRYSKRLYQLTTKRNNRVNEFINQTINYLVKYCVKNQIGNIIIGDFKDLQRHSNLGHVNNQNFCQIPFGKFKLKLESKCQGHGIKLIRQEETFTSLCSFADQEEISKKDEYLGRRIKRGLYKTKSGQLVNADSNAACNIFAKYIQASKQNLDYYFKKLYTGLVNSPLRIRLLGPIKLLNKL